MFTEDEDMKLENALAEYFIEKELTRNEGLERLKHIGRGKGSQMALN